MPTFRLAGDRIAVKLDEAESVTQGGIHLPDNAKEKSVKGTVVAVGVGKWNETHFKPNPIRIAVGQRVLIEKYGQTKIEVDGEEFTTLHEEDVLALLPAETNGSAKAAKKK
jgi:chaperonin GroES